MFPRRRQRAPTGRVLYDVLAACAAAGHGDEIIITVGSQYCVFIRKRTITIPHGRVVGNCYYRWELRPPPCPRAPHGFVSRTVCSALLSISNRTVRFEGAENTLCSNCFKQRSSRSITYLGSVNQRVYNISFAELCIVGDVTTVTYNTDTL